MEDSKLPFDAETAQKLVDNGQLSKEWFSRVYEKLAASEAQDADKTKDGVADKIAETIQSSPDAADVANRVQQKVAPQGQPDTTAASPAASQGPLPVVMNGTQGPLPVSINQSPSASPAVAAAAQPVNPDNGIANLAGIPPPPGIAPDSMVGQLINNSPQPQQAAEPPAPQVNPGNFKAAPQPAPQISQTAVDDAQTGNTPGVREELQKSYEEEIAATKQAMATAAAGGSHVAGALASSQVALEGLAKENAARMQRDTDNFNQQTAKINDAYDSIQKEGIDPNRWWHNQSNLGKVSSLLGIFLGGLKLPGDNGPNQALEIIDKAIDRDIQSQKAAIELKKFGVQGKETLLERMIQKTNSDTQGEELTRAALADSLRSKVEMAKVGAENANTQAQLSLGLAKLHEEHIKNAIQYGSLDVAQGGGATEIGQVPNVPDSWNALEYNRTRNPKRQGVGIPGIGIMLPGTNNKAIAEVVKNKGLLETIVPKFDELIKKTDSMGSFGGVHLLQHKGDNALTAEHNLLLLELSRAESANAIPKQILETVRSEIGADPTGGGPKQLVNNITSQENGYTEKLKKSRELVIQGLLNRISPYLEQKDPRYFNYMSQDPRDQLAAQATRKNRAVGLNE